MLNPIPSVAQVSSPFLSVAVVLSDERAVPRLVELLIERSGLSQAEIARRMGIQSQSLNQYKIARRSRPSLQWLARLAETCGAKILVEFPQGYQNRG